MIMGPTGDDARIVKVQNMASECVAILHLTGQECLETLWTGITKNVNVNGLPQLPMQLVLADGSILEEAQQLNRLADGDVLTIAILGVADNAPVITDIGSTMCRVGVVGEDGLRGQFACNAVAPNHFFLESSGPMTISMDFDAMRKIWQHAFFNELGINPKDHPVLTTLPPLTPMNNVEQVVQMMFDDFDVPALILVSRSKLAFFQAHFSSGPFRDPMSFYQAMGSDDYGSWNIGIVIHISDKFVSVVPIYQGYEMPHAIQLSPRGGQNLTVSFARALGMPSQSAAEISVVRHIMMQGIHPLEFSHDVDPQQNIEEIRSQCIETFLTYFLDENGWKLPSKGKSFGDFFRETVALCDEDIRVDVCRNIVLCGSLARLPGLSESILEKLEVALKSEDTNAMWNGALRDGVRIRLGPCDEDVPQFKRVLRHLVVPPEAAFSGARSFYNQLREHNVITPDEYMEKGSAIGRQKFF